MKSYKSFIKEAKTATNFEAFITVAFNGGPRKDPKTLANAGLSVSDYNEYKSEATSIAKILKSKFGTKKPMVHYGAGSAKTIDWWIGKGTPKTDNYIDNNKLSLKEAGGSQIMSAKKGESISTFNAAIKHMDSNAPDEAFKFVDIISKFMSEIVMPKGGPTIGEFTKAVKAEKSIPKALESLSKRYLKSDTGKKKMTEKMNSFFANNSEFSKWFTYEAATGQLKFQPEPVAAANWVLKFSTDGTVHELTQLSRGGKPTKYIDTLSGKVKYRFSWKTPTSRGKKTYMSLRGDILKEDLDYDNIDNLIEKECSRFEDELLSEGLIDIAKKGFQKVKNFFASLIKKIIDAAKKIARKGISPLLDFFGVEIGNVQISGLEY